MQEISNSDGNHGDLAFYPVQKTLNIGELSPLIEGIVSQ